MTTDHAPMPESQDSTPSTEEAVKPKRTRRTKAADDAGTVASAAEATPVVAVADEAKPKRAPRRRKADAEAAEAAEPVTAEAAAPAEADVAAEAPAKPKRAPRRKVVAEAEAPEAAEPVQAEAVQAATSEAAAREVTPHGVFELGPDIEPAAGEVAAMGESAREGERVAAEPRGERQGRQRDRDGRGPRGDRAERGDRHERAERRGGEQGAAQAGAGEDGQGEGAEGAEFGESIEQRTSRRAAIAQQQATEVFDELLSGDFDNQREEEAAEASTEDSGPYKRVLRPEPDAPKLQKVLAQAGVGSRRDIEQMIEDGRIEVNDQVAHIGQRISYGDRVKVAGKPIKVRIAPPPARILAYHKPVGEVVTHDDPQGRPTVFRRLPRLQNGKWMSVGRLDLNTEGLLLFTNSGELANQLMHPRFGVEREYAVRVLGSLDDAARERLLTGVEIEGQSASFVSISNGLGEGVNQWYRVVITEGRNREVRKLFDAVGLTVNRLIRVRYGAIVLPRGLRRGVWVELGESDVRAVKSLAGMDRQEQQQDSGRGNNKGKHKSQQGQRGQQGQQGQGQGQQGQGQRGKQGGQQGQQGPRGQQGQGGRPQQGGQQGQGRPQRQQGNDRPSSQDHDGDDDHFGPIPNPLEQTFDRRFVKSGSKRITSGFGRPDQDHGQSQQGGKQKGPRQPDPMQTSVGYIGADAYFGGGRSGGNRRGGGGGGGGGGGRGRR